LYYIAYPSWSSLTGFTKPPLVSRSTSEYPPRSKHPPRKPKHLTVINHPRLHKILLKTSCSQLPHKPPSITPLTIDQASSAFTSQLRSISVSAHRRAWPLLGARLHATPSHSQGGKSGTLKSWFAILRTTALEHIVRALSCAVPGRWMVSRRIKD